MSRHSSIRKLQFEFNNNMSQKGSTDSETSSASAASLTSRELEHIQWLGQDISQLNFLGILQIIQEKEMIRLMGRDLCIYLKFLRMQAIFFFSIFLVQSTILVPIYYFGTDAQQYLQHNQQTNNTTTTYFNATTTNSTNSTKPEFNI